MQCYFCQTFYWDELKKQADEFRSLEPESVCKQLKDELTTMVETHSWEYIRYFISRRTDRRISGDKEAKHLFDTILGSLS